MAVTSNNEKIPKSIMNFPIEEYFASGHGACAGCGPAIAMRLLAKIAGPNTIVVNATGCMEVVSTKYPTTSWKLPWVHGAFENAAPIASGVHAALTVQGIRDKHNILVIGGDGATYDIGLGALSGALARRDKFTYVCYNNEAYANTGSQASGATPFGAWSTTTPIGKIVRGNALESKPLTEIVAAHKISYVATACVGYEQDLMMKLKKAFEAEGPSFINLLAPCVLNWKIKMDDAVEISRLAVDTGMWFLYEIENGKFTLNVEPKMLPVTDYIQRQGRFKHLDEVQISELQREISANWEHLQKEIKCFPKA